MHEPHRLLYSPSGEIDVNQGTESGWYLSYNPCDGKFYVSPNSHGTNARTFKEWRNAIQYARRNPRS